MSSPIHHADDLDPALVYAPPRVRAQLRFAKTPADWAPLETPPPWRRVAGERRVLRGDPALARLRQQRALNPETVPDPPVEDRPSAWPLTRSICAVAGIAALIAGCVVLLPNMIKPAKEPRVLVTAAPRVEAQPIASEQQPEPVPAEPVVNRVKVVHVTAAGDMPPAVAETLTPQPEQQPSAASPPVSAPEPAPQAAEPKQNVSALGSDERDALVKRGKSYLENGDFASARLLLRRAADAGSADAALALGATFDPLVIKQLGAIGAEPDLAKARQWYEAASKLGSQAASQQLARLAEVQQ